tara:strand:- start:263 stop:640 length:378 start_codon:yes stop_codon:yes gene_type:complete
VISLAKVSLLSKEEQDERNAISSFVFQNITFVAGEPAQEVSTQIGVMYMKEPNFLVQFTEADFKDLPEELLVEMGEKLNCDVKSVKTTLLPRKSVASKVKSTLTKPKIVEEKKVEEPAEEESSDE